MNLLRLGTIATGAMLLVLAPLRGGDYWAPGYGPRTNEIGDKLKTLVVSIDFNRARIDQALDALAVMSRQADPDHKGVNFVLQPEATAEAKPVTLKLDNVPLGVAVHYLCELARVRCKIDSRLVTIEPLWGEDALVSRTFHVDPDFVKAASSSGAIPPVPRL